MPVPMASYKVKICTYGCEDGACLKEVQNEKNKCQMDSDCGILGIRINSCCSCPKVYPQKQLDEDEGLIIYEEGIDYSTMRPQDCENTVCVPTCGETETPKCVNNFCKWSSESTSEKVCCLITVKKETDSYQKYDYLYGDSCLEFNNYPLKNAEIVKEDLCYERELNKIKTEEEIKKKQELKFENKTKIDCPDYCICEGSKIKCLLEDGAKEMKVYSSSGKIIVQIKDSNFTTNVTLYKDEDGKLYKLKNGQKENINFYPEQIEEKIKEELKQKNCDCEEIELDEEGYKVEVKKEAKLLGFISVKEKVKMEFDPETGNLKNKKSSWWGFLAKDK